MKKLAGVEDRVCIEVPMELWEAVMFDILQSWISGEGNNLHAALETAVSFLPPHD